MALFDIELTVEWYVFVHTTNISHSLMFIVDIHDYAEYFDCHGSIENFTISTFEWAILRVAENNNDSICFGMQDWNMKKKKKKENSKNLVFFSKYFSTWKNFVRSFIVVNVCSSIHQQENIVVFSIEIYTMKIMSVFVPFFKQASQMRIFITS